MPEQTCPDCGTTMAMVRDEMICPNFKCCKKPRSRIDAIGQNGGDGIHYAILAPKTAQGFLHKADFLMIQRGTQYDKPEGERSMGRAVAAFNTITGRDLRESEGWLLQQILKDVRQWQNPDKYHADSAEDCVAYAALKGEALVTEGVAS